MTNSTQELIQSTKTISDEGKIGYLVKVPFEFKDEFKGAFPSAKWEPETKSWVLGSKSGKKLINLLLGELLTTYSHSFVEVEAS